MFFNYFILFLIIFVQFGKSVDCNDEKRFLVENFFDNLQEEYKNVINVEPSENLKMVIDARIDSFLTTVYNNPVGIDEEVRPKRDLNKLLSIEQDDGKFSFYSKLNKYFFMSLQLCCSKYLRNTLIFILTSCSSPMSIKISSLND